VAVGVLDGGSLAGNDSSNSSSSFCSALDRGMLGGGLRGSFIAASPWRGPASEDWDRTDNARRRSEVPGSRRSTATAGARFCTRLKVFNGLGSFFCNSKSYKYDTIALYIFSYENLPMKTLMVQCVELTALCHAHHHHNREPSMSAPRNPKP
jgi:hypothetical protein